ncbi:MAG: hypothetical protein QM630_03770 [Microbacterium sp.]
MPNARRAGTRESFGPAFAVFAASAALVVALFAAFLPAISSAAVTTGAVAPPAASVVKTTLTGFSAGNIISDAVFTKKNTMTEAQIQAFFNSKVSKCLGGTDEDGRAIVCLKDFRMTTVNRPADAYCSGYTGAANETAARIIYRVSQACNINPQVLIVMLQKEQGLVTHVWPSAWRYDIALGQGCPDTAACDPEYVGFFHQIYGAARQMQLYMEGRYFTWYAPGKTWNIRYNPNTACGTSPVYVANKATSALYYYTPYQPNAAALRAGYGLGDACSAYGNRNFYNYFTDWFGSTQASTGVVTLKLIQYGDPVYLVSGTTRYHVTKADFPEFTAALGTPTTVTAETVSAYTDGGDATRFLRNASTGEVSYLEGGSRHYFSSCAMVAAWGSACNTETKLTAADHDSLTAGNDMTWYASVTSSDRTMLIADDELRPVYDDATLAKLNGGTAPYVADLQDAVAEQYDTGLTKFLTANYLTVSGSKEVFLPTDDGRLVYLAAWAFSAEFGLPSSTFHQSIAASEISGYTKSGTLNLFATCGSTTYAASNGKLFPVTTAAAEGFDAPALDDAICKTLSLQKTTALDQVFIQVPGTNPVYLADDGQYRLVTSRAVMNVLTGGVSPTVLPATAATFAKLTVGADITEESTLVAGAFVRSDASTKVYLPLSGRTKLYLPAWAYASELGLSATQRVVSASLLDAYTETGQIGLFVACGSTSYVASQGKLIPVTSAAVKGFSVPTLDESTCAVLDLTTGTPLSAVYVQGIGKNEVYAAQNGVFRPVASRAALEKLNGGSWPTVIKVGAATITALPKGATIS